MNTFYSPQTTCLCLLAVDEAQVAVPPNRHNVGEEEAVLQRHEAKVDNLHKGPHQPVGLQRRPPRLVQTSLGACALHGRHAAEEDTNHDGGEGELVTGHAGEDLDLAVGVGDAASEEAEPGGRYGTEDTWRMSVNYGEDTMRYGVRNVQPP